MIPGLSPALGAISQPTTAAAGLEQTETTDETDPERAIERLKLTKVIIDDSIEEMESDTE